MNAVILAVLVMVGLSLARVSVVFALVAGALVGGLVGGLSLSETLSAFFLHYNIPLVVFGWLAAMTL
ncbi:hypothetical protein L861_01880 [Litchfieldella anticariensis FP35 = DSM 16096]|uniref:Putative Na+/H+ antiporter N-terminal domain-containing protein n=1 Tax=Litchfieldella anticariensis (strain DSM 16096 / CECT 5854 / CIP 108499 / LMG 22089 / FP35) TaxID=1121939 RepID=S2LHE5_LITA3|nr:hypothetical protein [Halomonas anticariensis]EPC04081.1 hypothetical protein L861_01880 [Halomonas anticariensis FP35 = DSM 16096]